MDIYKRPTDDEIAAVLAEAKRLRNAELRRMGRAVGRFVANMWRQLFPRKADKRLAPEPQHAE